VVVERLPPVPAKPQQVFIERWLPYGQQTQRVIFQGARPSCVIPDPKNVVIQWEAPDVEIRREVKNLGVHLADPREYVSRYGAQLVSANALPEIAVRFSNQQGIQLAANSRQEQGIILEGDVQALRLIDVEREGLGYLRSRLSGSLGNLSSQQVYSSSSAEYSGAAAATASYGASSPSFGASRYDDEIIY
jgi:hypothetical protein